MASTIVNTAESRKGASVPVLEYDFENGQSVSVSASATFSTDLPAGKAYMIVSSASCFFSVIEENNASVGPTDTRSTYLVAGVPFHLFVSDISRASFRRAGDEDGRAFITGVKSR